MTDIIGNRTIPMLLDEMTSLYPSKPFILFEDKRENIHTLTYEQFSEKVKRLASVLHNYGIGKGDKVLLHLPNSADFMISWFAITSIGGIMVPTNILSTEDEISYLINHSGTKLVITEDDYIEKFASFIGKLNGLFLSRSNGNTSYGRSLDQLIEATEPICQLPELSSNDLAAILYTSGTTSKPKGVLITHANYLFAGEVMSRSLRLAPCDRVFIVLPLFHGNGQYYLSMPALTVGASIAITEGFSATRYFKQAKRLKGTVGSLFAAPIKMILKKDYDPSDAENNLRLIVFAQSITSEQLVTFEKYYKVPLCQLYGMTETIGTPLINPINGIRDNQSIGRPNLGYQVKLIDENGNEVKEDEEGQIIVSGVPGRTIMKGYYNNAEATNNTIQDNWLHTGDMACKSSRTGLFYFVDRKKDMIKRAGENVAASEVESVINQFNGVFESAVIGTPDEIKDESIHAFVILKDGIKATPQEIIDFCKERLANFKVPESVHFLEDFPRTSVGKIQKHLLKNYLPTIRRS